MIINKTRVNQLFKLTNPGSFYVGISIAHQTVPLSVNIPDKNTPFPFLGDLM